jgi:hypothetical protein
VLDFVRDCGEACETSGSKAKFLEDAAMKRHLSAAAALVLAAAAPLVAHASTIYSNENTDPLDADCSFNTTCAADNSLGDEFAAQAFSLASGTTITRGSWIEADFGGSGSTAVNYAFYKDGGAGVPVGAALFSGSAATGAVDLGPSTVFSGHEVFRVSFDLPSINLAAGDYFVAIQDVSSNETNYLGLGNIPLGAAETSDGGLTWTPGYETLGGIGVALYNNAVPEPTTWSLMVIGFGGLGAVLRASRKILAGGPGSAPKSHATTLI